MGAGGPGRGGGQPGVERGPADVQDRAEPLHLEGVPVISDELEAVHQRVSPAKYLAAWRRMSRSVASRVFSDSRAATRARNTASSACGEPGRGRAVPPPAAGAGAPVGPVVGSGSSAATQAVRVPQVIPRSVAMPRRLAPGVDR